MGARLEQLGTAMRRQRGGMAERHRIMRLCLAVGAEPGGVVGCGRRELQNGCGISSAGGVVDDPGKLRRILRARAQRAEDAGVQLVAAQRRQRILDGATGQFVPEGDGAVVQRDDPGGEQVMNGEEHRPACRFEKRQIRARGNDRGQLAEIVGEG